MIVAVGIDVVLVDRFARSLARTPLLADRLFTDAERYTRAGNPRSPESMAARFAAKEAVAKALGAPAGLNWHDCEVVPDPEGRPWLAVSARWPPRRLSAGSTAGTCRCRTTAGSRRPWWSRNGEPTRRAGRPVRDERDERTGRSGMRPVWRVADVPRRRRA
ncbi:hypothetical protein Nm8I071_03130 [Nonomuraea sp. TT08I-71]|nr:hypothetical protein Nm8I071_03130 [Nonomuraea sp. TT08I-71]